MIVNVILFVNVSIGVIEEPLNNWGSYDWIKFDRETADIFKKGEQNRDPQIYVYAECLHLGARVLMYR